MKLPIGIQDFRIMREGGYTYVDKTQHIHTLLQGARYQFLSRPRRFGKSLLISTLRYLFEGRRELFEGLWIAEHHDFKIRPVIRLDLSQLDFQARALEVSLLESFRQSASRYDLELKADTAKSAFEELILALSSQGPVVVLIDEYDKPITDYLFDEAKRTEHIQVLRSVYGLLKPLNEYLHLVFLTGVSKIGKLSLFSDLNNLSDISLDRRFAELLGYNRAEIEQVFPDYLKGAASELGLTQEQLWEALQYWYNGYSWDGLHRLYCPFSFLQFLNNPLFKGYWYETGTPSFLIQMIAQAQFSPLEFEHLNTENTTLSSFNVEALNPVSIMFQTGYLSIQKLERTLEGVEYQLSYPNNEVRQAFSSQLLGHYTHDQANFVDSLGFKLRKALQNLEWNNFFESIQKAYASILYWITPDQEAHFHALFHMLMCATGLPTQSELATRKGRIDTVVDTRQHIVIFEFKLSGTPEEALNQINEQDYAEPFTQPVYKVGVVFDVEQKNIGAWAVGN